MMMIHRCHRWRTTYRVRLLGSTTVANTQLEILVCTRSPREDQTDARQSMSASPARAKQKQSSALYFSFFRRFRCRAPTDSTERSANNCATVRHSCHRIPRDERRQRDVHSSLRPTSNSCSMTKNFSPPIRTSSLMHADRIVIVRKYASMPTATHRSIFR